LLFVLTGVARDTGHETHRCVSCRVAGHADSN
jgi:hypothetical protein